MSDKKTEVVLYRCPTPTNFLCPCGAAARKLKRAGVEYRTERVPYNRKSRPEIEELTGQRRVPVLVDSEGDRPRLEADHRIPRVETQPTGPIRAVLSPAREGYTI